MTSSVRQRGPPDTSITDGLIVARLVHMDLVVAQMKRVPLLVAWAVATAVSRSPMATSPSVSTPFGQVQPLHST